MDIYPEIYLKKNVTCLYCNSTTWCTVYCGCRACRRPFVVRLLASLFRWKFDNHKKDIILSKHTSTDTKKYVALSKHISTNTRNNE